MEWWQTLLMTAGTCFVTLLVTFIFNYIINKPKQKKEEEAIKEKERKQELIDMEQRISSQIEEVKQERIAEREACCKDHISLVNLVTDIQKTNKAQNIGLQAVLKDLLKIRYLEWIHKSYAPMDARDDLERMYQAYHNLGANGVMDSLREQFLSLPEYKRKKNKNTDLSNEEEEIE